MRRPSPQSGHVTHYSGGQNQHVCAAHSIGLLPLPPLPPPHPAAILGAWPAGRRPPPPPHISYVPPRLRPTYPFSFPTTNQPQTNPKQGYKLFVGNLSFRTQSAALRDAFEPFGRIVFSTVIENRETGQSR